MTLPCDVLCVEMRWDGSAMEAAMSAPHLHCEWIVVVNTGATVRLPPLRYIGQPPYRFPRATCSRRYEPGAQGVGDRLGPPTYG
jgi:hypothetical protein